VLLEEMLPGEELGAGDAITIASLVPRNQAATDGADHLGLSSRHPPDDVGGRQFVDRDRFTVRIADNPTWAFRAHLRFFILEPNVQAGEYAEESKSS